MIILRCETYRVLAGNDIASFEQLVELCLAYLLHAKENKADMASIVSGHLFQKLRQTDESQEHKKQSFELANKEIPYILDPEQAIG